jgi:tRNA G37 N-methylase Trm5
VLAQHRATLDRDLVVFDPYAGVGPNLGLPITEGGVAAVVAGDLNPEAMPFLEQNLSFLAERSGREVKVTLHGGDGRAWRDHPSLLGMADAVFVNLPHDAPDHLTDLVPLLADDAVVLGWSIADRDAEADLSTGVRAVFEAAGREVISLDVEPVKGYSTTQAMLRLMVRSTTGS